MLSDLWFRLRSVFHRTTVEDELEDELRFHLEQQVEKLRAGGFSPEEARRRARLEFGGLQDVKEECRDARGVAFLETLARDVRFGVRVLGRTPMITGVAVLSLALGIGANTAVFSLIDKVVLRFLPVEKPQELMQLYFQEPEKGSDPSPSFTYPLWEQFREHQEVFSGVFSWSDRDFDLAQGGPVRHVEGMFVSGEYFSTLGVRPAVGRLIVPGDDQRRCPAVVAISYDFWRNYFGGVPSATGSTLSIDHQPFQVIGVSSSGFDGVNVGRKFAVAIPNCTAAIFDGARTRLDQRSRWWLRVMGRVRPGVSKQQVDAGLAVVSPQVVAGALPQDWHPEDQKDFLSRQLVARPAATGVSQLRRQFQQPLTILMGVVGLVLLIACANIASLMFARAAARTKEIAVRKALGASRSRLVRQLLTESVLLSVAGAALGVLFARWGTSILVDLLSTKDSAVYLDLSFDTRILLFTTAITVLTAILFGLLPAFRATRISLTAAMKGVQAMASDARKHFRPGRWIIASQVAMSLVLVIGAGLFLRSLVKIVTLDTGFDRRNVLVVRANLQTAHVPEERWVPTFDQMQARLSELPGVVSASRSILTPVSNNTWNNFIIVDSPHPPKGDDALVYFNFISPSYLDTMRTPLLAGRNFTTHEAKNSTQVTIVNETLAKRFYPGENPIGKTFRIDIGPKKPQQVVEIVGVMKDAKYETLREATLPTAFFPIAQLAEKSSECEFELRTAIAPGVLTAAVQETIGRMNKSIPLEFMTLAQQVDDSLVQERLLATLSAFFGALALLLAAIGLYGALSYLVTQRRTEFGIRMALGAMPSSILQLVMRDVIAVLGGGIVTGVGISLLVVGILRKLLFDLAPHDPATMLGAIGVLAVVAFLAGYLPARRAMRSDPMTALRYE